MASEQLLSVKLGQLELGLPLRYNVFAEDGELLAPAGMMFTNLLKSLWSDRGIATIRIQVADSPADDIQILLRPYDPEVLKRLAANLELAKVAVYSLTTRLADRQAVNNTEFHELATLLLTDIQQDSAIALLSLVKTLQEPPSANDQLLANRCSQLSLLSMVIASELQWDEPSCRITGLAGLLHDVSLFEIPPWLSHDDQIEAFNQHSLKSAYMVERVLGIDPRVCMAIAQVHESLLGNGYPRELHGSRITPMAKVVHLADAYLTLTASQQPTLFPAGKNLHPSDGLGYIMHHAAKGRYEIEMVKALVRTASLYPVGSPVKLSDETVAVVFRSSNNPSAPVVQLPDQRLIDLRFSKLSILGPCRNSGPHWSALRISQLNDVELDTPNIAHCSV